ncbi:MAG: hypothetical protein BJ554DRAFT_2736, partial [Olpidium bornovanus]
MPFVMGTRGARAGARARTQTHTHTHFTLRSLPPGFPLSPRPLTGLLVAVLDGGRRQRTRKLGHLRGPATFSSAEREVRRRRERPVRLRARERRRWVGGPRAVPPPASAAAGGPVARDVLESEKLPAGHAVLAAARERPRPRQRRDRAGRRGGEVVEFRPQVLDDHLLRRDLRQRRQLDGSDVAVLAVVLPPPVLARTSRSAAFAAAVRRALRLAAFAPRRGRRFVLRRENHVAERPSTRRPAGVAPGVGVVRHRQVQGLRPLPRRTDRRGVPSVFRSGRASGRLQDFCARHEQLEPGVVLAEDGVRIDPGQPDVRLGDEQPCYRDQKRGNGVDVVRRKKPLGEQEKEDVPRLGGVGQRRTLADELPVLGVLGRDGQPGLPQEHVHGHLA